jgi:hypothetical protein
MAGRRSSVQLRLDLGSGQKRESPDRANRDLRRVTVMPNEAAAMLGVSRDFFDEHVKPELRVIRRGRKMILIPVAELERWVEQSAARWAEA